MPSTSKVPNFVTNSVRWSKKANLIQNVLILLISQDSVATNAPNGHVCTPQKGTPLLAGDHVAIKGVLC